LFFDYFVLYSEYDNTQEIFVNAYPWLFPGGIGDLYDPEFGDRGIQPKHWARHLLNYEDGRFARSQMFTLYTYNTVQRHANNSNGHWFFKSDRFIGENPPTLDDLKQQLKNKDDTFIKKNSDIILVIFVGVIIIGEQEQRILKRGYITMLRWDMVHLLSS